MTRPDRLHIDTADEWHRLSPWMMAVKPVELLPSLVPVLIALVFAGQGAPLFTMIATAVIVPLVTVVPWLTTRYQVTDDHVRVRSGLVTRRVATARRDRIRSVDLTASPVHRLLKLQKVKIGTGGDDESSAVTLTALPIDEARALHDNLMATRPHGAMSTAQDGEPPASADHDTEVLARFETSWLRYSPFSVAGLALAAGAAGLAAQIANDAGVFSDGIGIARDAFDAVRQTAIGLVIAGVALVVTVVGALLSVLAYVLNYWNFRLIRHADGTLRTERGLLTTNAISFDEQRIRGSHLTEPVLMRPLKGARLHAIATGSTKHPLLLPPAPIDEAMRVAGLVTHERAELTTPLVRHGRTASLRRLTRGFLFGAIMCAGLVVAVVAGAVPAPWVAVGVLAVLVSTALGGVRARHLGHRVTARSVVIAPPTVARQRIVIDRDGVLGWADRSSIFQRRNGISTLTVATAAGAEHYAMVDVDDRTAAAITGEVSGDWMRPFLTP
ncbi:PH domain-containing protein [Gordonia sp. 'Campus']|uniref:PH domain-containing protein n=1 Tax=Gordonia sp. 'Campus' TaxID=2915824 RepID=UPI001EE473EA|nr:PH domain-containing protein [Gordonia sp. 'Campus']